MRARAMSRATLLLLAAALTFTAYRTAAQAPMTPADAIDARQKLMKEQGKAWKDIQDKTKAGQIAAIVPDAEKLLDTSKRIPDLFPEGSLNPDKSNAKPEIWQRRAEFDAAARNLETWSAKLRDAAMTNDADQTQAIVKDFGRQACGTCHQPFRVPPKQQ